MSALTTEVVDYCAQECAWQGSGELSVGWMVHAWEYALSKCMHPITVTHIRVLGKMVEPEKNKNGFRRQPVWVGYNEKMDWERIDGATKWLVEEQVGGVDPIEWFRKYEDIHPFIDGNGRTGTLLYNWLLHTLDHPVHVPNLWNDPRR